MFFLKQVFRAVASGVMGQLSRFFPKRAHIVVHGFPNDEGNAVEVVRALLRRYAGTVYWLVDERHDWALTKKIDRLRLLEKKSLRGVLAYLTAESVFFTHGLYGDARPGPGATFVNLWHGDGFKIKDAAGSKRPPYQAHFVVGSTQLLTARKAFDFKMAPEKAIVTGNPRIDQFSQALPLPLLKRIRGDDNSQFVVWLPTYRKSIGAGSTKGWSDVSQNRDLRINLRMQDVIDELSAAGLQVVVKPHPLDEDSRRVKNAHVFNNDDLGRAGATLYGLLGASSGLITDYSSVWTDYLVLDRPIAFFVPDLQDYLKTRGLIIEDLFDWVPGPLLETGASIRAYANEVLGVSRTSATLRLDAARKLGLAPAGLASDRLLTVLDEAGAFSKAGGLVQSDAAEVMELPNVLLRRL